MGHAPAAGRSGKKEIWAGQLFFIYKINQSVIGFDGCFWIN
jgi:hypothetical protein